MKDLIIVGAGGFGRGVAWTAERTNKAEPTWNILGFLDDDEGIQGTTLNGYPILGKIADVGRFPEAYFVCAIAASKVREKIIARMKAVNPAVRFGKVVDPSASISELVSIGEGAMICAHTSMNVNIDIGEHVIINMNCTVGHDAVLSDFVTLYPGVNVSGRTNIGRGVELGTGMQVIQGKTIGDYSIVGAGAVVIHDLPADCTAVGCPARPIKFNQKQD